MRAFVERAVVFIDCSECHGMRLAQHARESYLNGASIADVCAMELADASAWLRTINSPLAVAPLRGLEAALDLGLGYLTLARPTGTLSGGEAQRTRMVRHIGSALTDVTYVFDEPTAGLHPHDVTRMNELLLQLRDKGNTVLVVEHNPATMAIADCVVELGPGAGVAGGEILSVGAAPSVSGKVALKDEVREPTGALEIRGASHDNLKGVDVDIPLGVLTVISGVAGSGKSSLMECLPDPLCRPVFVVWFAALQPGHLHRCDGRAAQGLRQGQRWGHAGNVLFQLGGRVPGLFRRWRGDRGVRGDGQRGCALRGLRGPPLCCRRFGLRAGGQEHRGGTRASCG